MAKYVDALYKDLLEYKEIFEGNLEAINNLTNRFDVINASRELHYDLLDQAILQSGKSYKILDVEVTGNDKADILSISEPIEILGFRLGRTFHEYKFEVSLNDLLLRYYESKCYNGFQYWVHKESTLTSDLIEAAYDYGFDTFDKMMLNSVFGQIYYKRD